MLQCQWCINHDRTPCINLHIVQWVQMWVGSSSLHMQPSEGGTGGYIQYIYIHTVYTHVSLYMFKTFNLLKVSASIYKKEPMPMDIRQC